VRKRPCAWTPAQGERLRGMQNHVENNSASESRCGTSRTEETPGGGGVFMHGREGVGLTYSPMSSPLTSWREAYIFFMSFMSFRILASDPPGPGWQGGRPRPKALVPVEVSGGRAGMPCRM